MAKTHTRKRGEAPKDTRTKKTASTKGEPSEKPTTKKSAAAKATPPGGGFIGRRVGRSSKDLGDALKRPEKIHGDYPVDTAKKGVSASDKKAGGGSTARRNSRKNDAGASYALEDSVTGTPSRKSTRKSANRQKPDSQLQRRETRRTTAPKSRATKAAANQTKTRGARRTSPNV